MKTKSMLGTSKFKNENVKENSSFFIEISSFGKKN